MTEYNFEGMESEELAKKAADGRRAKLELERRAMQRQQEENFPVVCMKELLRKSHSDASSSVNRDKDIVAVHFSGVEGENCDLQTAELSYHRAKLALTEAGVTFEDVSKNKPVEGTTVRLKPEMVWNSERAVNDCISKIDYENLQKLPEYIEVQREHTVKTVKFEINVPVAEIEKAFPRERSFP